MGFSRFITQNYNLKYYQYSTILDINYQIIMKFPCVVQVPEGWHVCAPCESVAPPRARHCGVCGHCILKREHHCIFTGCCVGLNNHRYFFLFLLYMWASTFYCSFVNAFFISPYIGLYYQCYCWRRDNVQ